MENAEQKGRQMGWYSYKVLLGETLEDVVRRYAPATEFLAVRKIADGVYATVFRGPAHWARYLTPDPNGMVNIAGIVLFEGDCFKWMDEGMGPYHAGKFPPDMLAMLSPIDPIQKTRWRLSWRDKQAA